MIRPIVAYWRDDHPERVSLVCAACIRPSEHLPFDSEVLAGESVGDRLAQCEVCYADLDVHSEWRGEPRSTP